MPHQASLITQEVGEDVFAEGNPDEKLVLFERWLYGAATEYEPRIAPSIIARSEAELLGISSPRFAIRVYLKNGSFANIRRRRTTARQIRKTYSESMADHLLAQKNNWIGDCLLVPPERLVQQGFKFLTCSLGRDYGEDLQSATPFVTHISIGGGLCAQAAAFMAICLLKNENIYGIAEITLLASDAPAKIEIHGLKPRSLQRFFQEAGLAAQLQCIALVPPARISELEKQVEYIRAALRIYVDNRIPVLVMLSASRMLGLYPNETKPSIPDPIIKSSKRQLDADATLLPLGGALHYEGSRIKEPNDTQRDHHCVVVVGRNMDASCFLLNDPATFPFVKCTPEQMFNARNYRSFTNALNNQSEKVVSETDLGQFQFLSITPPGVNLWLLGLVGDAIPSRGGLLSAIQTSMIDGSFGITYPRQAAAAKNLNMHLGKFNEEGQLNFRSNLELEPDCLRAIQAARLPKQFWYWVSEVDSVDKTQVYQRSLAFWDASQEFKPGLKFSKLLKCVVGQRSN